MARVELVAGDPVLPGHDLLEPLGAEDPERCGELVHTVVEPGRLVVRLAVVPEVTRELDQVVVPGDEDAALAGRDRLRRRERPQPGVAERPGLAAVPGGAVRVRAVLEQDDPLGAAQLGDPVDVEGDVTADMDDHRRRPARAVHLPLEVVERHAEVVAVAVDELDPGAGGEDRERRGHEGVRRAEHGLAAQLEVLERRERRAGPARGRDRRQPVPRRPRRPRTP